MTGPRGRRESGAQGGRRAAAGRPSDVEAWADLDDLLATAGYYRLSDTDALEVVRQVRDAVSTWRQVATLNGLARAALAEMAPAFVNAASARAGELLD